jgi:protein gp37
MPGPLTRHPIAAACGHAAAKSHQHRFKCFHEEVPVSFISEVFQIMGERPQHTFQVLTKRSKRLCELSKALPWPDNVWIGVTVENNDYLY